MQQDRRHGKVVMPHGWCMCDHHMMPRDNLICHEPPGACKHKPESPAELCHSKSDPGDVSVDHVSIMVVFSLSDNFYFESLIEPSRISPPGAS